MKNKLLPLLILIMRFSAYTFLFYTTMLAGVVIAADGNGQSLRDTYLEKGFQNNSLLEVFTAIEANTPFNFHYNRADLDKAYRLTLPTARRSVAELLETLSRDNGLRFKQLNNNISVSSTISGTDFERNRNPIALMQISGKVTSSEGESLPGVNVVEKGTVNGSVTDIDGNYKLSVEEGAVLVFSFIGYKTVEATVTANPVLNMIMEEDVKNLQEMVVTGIFERREESYTGSAVTIKGEELERVSNNNVFESLKNLDPSLNIIESLDFGSDPNRLPEIQLRGTATFPGSRNNDLKGNYQSDPNQPLFILDGFPASATTVLDMDMQRIASVTILKDAAAKAIYGSKAGNGVVVIETRRPLDGDLRLTYDGSTTITIPDLTSYNLTNALEKLEVEQRNGVYRSTSITQLVRLQKLYDERLKKSLEGDDTYWLSKPVHAAVGHKHAISLEYGEQKTKFIANLSYTNREGVMKESNRENIVGAMSLEYRHNNLLFRNSISITSNESSDSPYGSFSEYVRMNPYWDAYNDDGTVAIGNDYTNPLHNAEINTIYNSSYFEFTNNFQTEWRVSDDLKLTGRIGLTRKTSDAHRFRPSSHTAFSDYEKEDFFRKGDYALNNGEQNDINSDINMQYTKSINKHLIMSNVGFFISSSSSKEIVNYAEGFPSDKITDISFALQYTLNKTPLSYENTVRDLGVLGVVAYSYDDRFLSDLTIRQNASSSFGSDRRWGTFWSAGIGWNLHNEGFLRSINGLDRFKIKVSVGTSGSQNFSSFQSLSTYEYFQDRNYNGLLGTTVKQLANEDLQWQQKFDINLGFDLKIHRLSLVFDYYQSNTNNLITTLPIAPSIGYDAIIENIGEVKNEGFELKANYQLIKV